MIEIEKNGERQTKKLMGSATVYLPWYGKPLSLVIMKGYGERPMILLTNLDLSKRGLDWILEIYLTRWKCEESYRFIKQGYNLEDVCVLSYTSLRNLMVMGKTDKPIKSIWTRIYADKRGFSKA